MAKHLVPIEEYYRVFATVQELCHLSDKDLDPHSKKFLDLVSRAILSYRYGSNPIPPSSEDLEKLGVTLLRPRK